MAETPGGSEEADGRSREGAAVLICGVSGMRGAGKGEEKMNRSLVVRNKSGRIAVSRKVRNPGGTKLRKEVDKEVGKIGKKMAKMLGEVATNGDVNTARLMIDLSDEADFTDPVERAKVINMTAQWANEPQWTEPPGETPGGALDQQAVARILKAKN